MGRRWLPWIALLSALVHGVGIARTAVPAQDGLKFIRVAREFGRRPWMDVVRGSDQHPLYPMAIAVGSRGLVPLMGDRPDTWRIAAQAVSGLASVILLLPLHAWCRRLFDRRTADLAVLLFAILPVPSAIGHDTLSDSLGLAFFTAALWSGERALRSRSWKLPFLCGLFAGFGYWTRPELAVLPVTILPVIAWSEFVRRRRQVAMRDQGVRRAEPGISVPIPRSLARWQALPLGLLTLVASYVLAKGEVSEKLAIRHNAASVARVVESSRQHWLPPGLDDPRLDFSAKEESERIHRFPAHLAVMTVLRNWAEGLGWVFAPLAILGAIRVRCRSRTGRLMVVAYVAIFVTILTRHAMGLGYLSGRHALTIVVATLPWAAAGALAASRRIAERLRCEGSTRIRLGRFATAGLILVLLGCRLEPAHAARWGHLAAGRWLAEHAQPGEAVLDTRGWAAFVSGLPAYDYWHVRQALTDHHLAFVIVGADELAAPSRRAATLRALLDHAGTLRAAFPGRRGATSPDVLVYRFRHPESWEGVTP